MRATGRNRASVSMLAVVFLVLGAVLASFLCSTMSSAVQAGRNQDASRQAALAAESGLDYLNVMLPKISADATIIGTTPSDVLDGLRGVLPGHLSGNPAITATGGSGTIGIGTVITETRSGATWSFETTIQTLRTTFDPTHIDPEFRVTVVGKYSRGGVTTSRTIGMDANAVSMAHPNATGFGILARGTIDLPDSNNGGVFLYDNGSLNEHRRAKAYSVEGGSVITFDDEAPPASVSLPAYPTSLYEKLNGYTGWDRNPVNPAAGSSQTWTNVRIAKDSPLLTDHKLVVTGNVTIEGVLYVEYPTSIAFGDSSTKEQTLTINGAIIWEPAPTGTAPETQTLSFGRYIGVNSPLPTSTDAYPRDTYFTTVLGANATRDLLNGDLVAAPQTDLEIESGDDAEGIKRFNGSLHIRNMTATGSGNVLKKEPTTGGMVLINAGIVAEGNVTMNGNSCFSVDPPDPGSMTLDQDRWRLAFAQRTYWEP